MHLSVDEFGLILDLLLGVKKSKAKYPERIQRERTKSKIVD